MDAPFLNSAPTFDWTGGREGKRTVIYSGVYSLKFVTYSSDCASHATSTLRRKTSILTFILQTKNKKQVDKKDRVNINYKQMNQTQPSTSATYDF